MAILLFHARTPKRFCLISRVCGTCQQTEITVFLYNSVRCTGMSLHPLIPVLLICGEALPLLRAIGWKSTCTLERQMGALYTASSRLSGKAAPFKVRANINSSRNEISMSIMIFTMRSTPRVGSIDVSKTATDRGSERGYIPRSIETITWRPRMHEETMSVPRHGGTISPAQVPEWSESPVVLLPLILSPPRAGLS